MSPQTSQQTTIEELLEAMIFVWSLPELYSKDEEEKLGNRESEVIVGNSIASLALLAATTYQQLVKT